MNGEKFLRIPATAGEELEEFVQNARNIPKSGLHNPYKNPDRYQLYGDINFKISEGLRDPEILEFFSHLTHRVMPKSKA